MSHDSRLNPGVKVWNWNWRYTRALVRITAAISLADRLDGSVKQTCY